MFERYHSPLPVEPLQDFLEQWANTITQAGIRVGFDIYDVEKQARYLETSPGSIIDRYTDEEIVYCEATANPLARAQRYAVRFSAKEAVVKALGGVSDEGFSYRDIHILKGESGKPFVYLEGRVKQRADDLGIQAFELTMVHQNNLAAAICLALPTPHNPA